MISFWLVINKSYKYEERYESAIKYVKKIIRPSSHYIRKHSKNGYAQTKWHFILQHHKGSRVCILTYLFNSCLEFILEIIFFLDEILFNLVSLIYRFFISIWFIQVVLKFSKLIESLFYRFDFHIFWILLPVVLIVYLNIEPVNFIKPKIRSRINHLGCYTILSINFWWLWILIFQRRVIFPFINYFIAFFTKSILIWQVAINHQFLIKWFMALHPFQKIKYTILSL